MGTYLPIAPGTSRKIVAGARCAQALTWLTPRFAARMFGLPGEGELQRDYWIRLFASRAVAVGAVGLSASPQLRAAGVRLSAAIDAADIAAAALAIRQRQVPARTGVAIMLVAVATLALNLNALDEPAD